MASKYNPRTPSKTPTSGTQPFRPSQHPNLSNPSNPTSYSFLNDSPSNYLPPKDGAPKLKVKSGITPEARVRLGASQNGLRPVTPRPTKLKSSVAANELPPRSASRAGSAVGSAGGVTRRGMTPSGSDGSLKDWDQSVVLSSAGENSYDVSEIGGSEELLAEHETVLVTIRVRPGSPAETQPVEQASVWNTPTWDSQRINLSKEFQGTRDDREWTFDRILDQTSDNARAYSTSARTHVKRAIEGYNALIFAYGQTASGKTHTLSGSPSAPGIIPLAIRDLFAQIRASPDRDFLLRASYLELYNESLFDLLSGDGKELSLSEGKKKGEVVVNGLTECAVRTEEEVGRLLRVGEESRRVGRTDWNARSSRSHCVFRLVIESRSSEASGCRTPGGKNSEVKVTRISTLSIIDLAGSEKHTSSKERNAEGKHINQSLLTLKIVIAKLADKASGRNVSHVPYRDSKLTRLLQPSLSGDALISVICTLSPSLANLNESLSTLAFAQGLKRVMLRAQKKEMMDPQALIQQYQEEIADLKAMLREREAGSSAASTMSSVAGSRVVRGKGAGKGKGEMEDRLRELKSLILTGGSAGEGGDDTQARPLSPTKLKFPKLNYDKTTSSLREDLHAAELKLQKQEEEIARLRCELEARAVDPDERILALQDEVAGLKMIADDYERNLLEPSRKVREDVEREWRGKVDKLERQLESKHIWACRLDENVRVLTEENKVYKARCTDAEQKVHLIIDWLNTTLSSSSPSSPTNGYTHSHADIPSLTIQAPSPDNDDDTNHDGPAADFGPAPGAGGVRGRTTLTLSARMTRDKISHMDLASLSERFGSLGVRAREGGVRMLREESCFDLSEAAGDDF